MAQSCSPIRCRECGTLTQQIWNFATLGTSFIVTSTTPYVRVAAISKQLREVNHINLTFSNRSTEAIQADTNHSSTFVFADVAGCGLINSSSEQPTYSLAALILLAVSPYKGIPLRPKFESQLSRCPSPEIFSKHFVTYSIPNQPVIGLRVRVNMRTLSH